MPQMTTLRDSKFEQWSAARPSFRNSAYVIINFKVLNLTLKDWVIFQSVILFSNVVHHKCHIFYIKFVQHNECLVSIVDTDGLVL